MASSQLSGPDENEDKPQWQTDTANYFDKQFRNEIQRMEHRMMEIIEAGASGNQNVDFNKDWQQDIEGFEEVNEELVEERKPSTEQEIRIRMNWESKIGGKEVHIEELVQEAKHDVEFSQDWKTKLDGNEVTFEERIEDPYSFDKDEEGFWKSPFYRGNSKEEDIEQEIEDLYESDFEDDEEGSYESDFEEEDDTGTEYEHVDLQNGITMTLPKLHVEKLKNMHFMPWSAEKRHNNLRELDICKMEMFCTDVYELSYTNKTKTATKSVGDIFNVPEKDANDVTIKVPLQNIEKGRWYYYQSRIYSGNKWKRTKASYFEDDGCQCVKFNVHKITAFCVTRLPKNEGCTIPEEGHTFTSRKDNRVIVKFPKGAVNSTEEMQFVLYPIDRIGMEWRLKNIPQKCNILAMSDCLYVNQRLPKFHLPVSVQLPIGEKVENCELVFFHWKEDKIQIIEQSSDRKIEKLNEGYTISVNSFSGYAAGLIRSMSFETISPVEIETNRGTLKQCTILVFAKKTYATFLSLWIEIVSIDKADEISKERENKHEMKEIPFCRSPDVFLYDTQRIRIDVSGNVKCIQTKEKIAHTLTFLHTANDSHLSFPLQIYRRMDGVPYAMIDFINDSDKRRVVRRLHTAHFDPERVSATETNTPRTFLYKSPPSQANQREQYHRSISAPEIDSQSHGLGSMKISKPNLHPHVETRPDDERRSTENQDFYTDQSLIWLAKSLPARDSYQFGIFLGIIGEDINRLKTATKGDPIECHMELLKKWKDSDKSVNKIDVLKKALENCDLNGIAHNVEKAYKEGRMLNRDDVK